MPKLVVDGVGEFDVPANKRLVLALVEDAGVDQLHACGGKARCTTCRVEFIRGEPPYLTDAEAELQRTKDLSGVRLSCQLLCDRDMHVRLVSRLAGSGRSDAGGHPSDLIEPPAQWGHLR